MSSSASAGQHSQVNPCTAPREGKPTAAEAKDVECRSIPLVIVLSLVTLCIYPIYLCYQWARELNGLVQRARHSPRLVVILGIVTLGLAGMIYECIFAHELERHFRERGRADAMPHLTTWVIALNAIGCVLVFTAILFPLAIPCGLAATCLLQAEFNKLAAQ